LSLIARKELRDKRHREGDKKHLLVVEDSQLVVRLLKYYASRELKEYAVHFAETYQRGVELFEKYQEKLFAAIVDLNLPDAADGEMAHYLLEYDVPVIILTGNYNEDVREKLIKMGTVDYVVKEGRYSYEYAIGLVKRLEKNQNVKVLVAEDSAPQRAFIKSLLEQHLYQVVTAVNGKEARSMLEADDGIKMLITDYYMPEMDGFELTKKLRSNPNMSDLIIIGLSGAEKNTISAKFIKNGANDFLSKPFIQEEFHCRITHNVKMLENIQDIREWAVRDALTKLYNRRYLFDQGSKMHAKAVAHEKCLSVAVIDIDHFKRINDEYGHAAGDSALIQLSDLFATMLTQFLLVRLGGEEFCVVIPDLSRYQVMKLMDAVRNLVSEKDIDIGDHTVNITISIGVVSTLHDSLDSQINAADKLLYAAKNRGRDCVIGEDDEIYS